MRQPVGDPGDLRSFPSAYQHMRSRMVAPLAKFLDESESSQSCHPSTGVAVFAARPDLLTQTSPFLAPPRVIVLKQPLKKTSRVLNRADVTNCTANSSM